jgi:antitoxin ParD1/3/4
MTNLSISIPDSLKDFVEQQVALGGYRTPSDYIRSLLCEAQDRKDRVELEGKLIAALDAEPIEMRASDWSQMRDRVRRMAAKE